MEQQVMPQPPMSSSRGVTYAGFWKRFAAHIIDKVIVCIAILILLTPFFLIMGIGIWSQVSRGEARPEFLMAAVGAYMLAIGVAIVAEWLYFALMESKKGATLGKMALGVKVTDMDGNKISFGRATGRHFSKIISGLTLTVGYIIAGFTQQKQALHDIIAKTLVVNKY